ncbi:hypothetical protein M3Y99_00404100 [Aphelenchoides fujianensis]|nr:hypothetical protein M3Y99_00404100 [Aphelenchoides fujianensis]
MQVPDFVHAAAERRGSETTGREEIQEKDDDEHEEEVQHVVPPLVHVNVSDVSKEDRERCKYRKSCYAGVESPPTVARTSTQSKASITPSGSQKPVIIARRPREQCKAEGAKYWLSCREHLGFPPKERAPIGPSGRRLCRKKRPDGNVSS